MKSLRNRAFSVVSLQPVDVLQLGIFLQFWRSRSKISWIAFIWLLFHRSISIFVKLTSNLKNFVQNSDSKSNLFIVSEFEWTLNATFALIFSRSIAETHHWMADPIFQIVDWSSAMTSQIPAQIDQAFDPFQAAIRQPHPFLGYNTKKTDFEVRLFDVPQRVLR